MRVDELGFVLEIAFLDRLDLGLLLQVQKSRFAQIVFGSVRQHYLQAAKKDAVVVLTSALIKIR